MDSVTKSAEGKDPENYRPGERLIGLSILGLFAAMIF
jgi:hypothetical protein